MKIEKLNLEKALQSGWTEWKKYGKNRLYFDVKNSELLDLGFYKSGNINFSEFKGEEISHSDAGKLVSSKVFIDLDTMELHVDSDADEDMLDEIVKNEIAKIEDEVEKVTNTKNDEKEENKMIKWVGKSTDKVWERTVEADNMQELFKKLFTMNIINDEEVHAYLVENSEEYSELTDKINELERLQDTSKFDELDALIQKQLTKLYDIPVAMNDSDLQLLIQSCNGKAFYQEFEEK